jgi:hypothetical protein
VIEREEAELAERSKLALERARNYARRNSIRAIYYAAALSLTLLIAIFFSLVFFIKTGKSFDQISEITKSTTIFVTALFSVYTLFSFVVLATGKANPFGKIFEAIGNFTAILVGTPQRDRFVDDDHYEHLQRVITRSDHVRTSNARSVTASRVSAIARMEIERAFEERGGSGVSIARSANDIFDQIKSRLERFSSTLLVRSIVNLAIGAVISVFAIYYLFRAIYNIAAPVPNGNLILIVSIRLTISISSILISYFFLSLYKNGLSEIKSVNDEITDIELKQIALLDEIVNNKNITDGHKFILLTGRAIDQGVSSKNSDSEKSVKSAADMIIETAAVVKKLKL